MDSRSACTHAWQVMFPPLQAHAEGWLDVGAGHHIHWHVSGHPAAPAALLLHGGPGAHATAADRRWFDPQRWRVVGFDQRGCGRSRAASLLHRNDTPHLLADIEALRQHLGISQWLLFGGSWGATLALLYAQQHPQRVTALVLRGVFMATRAERDGLYGPSGAAAQQQPAAWQRLCAGAGLRPPARRPGAGSDSASALLHALQRRLRQVAPASTSASIAQPAPPPRASTTAAALPTAAAAAHAWCDWEDDLIDAEIDAPPPRRRPSDAAALAQARIGVHYARAGWFIPPGQVLARAKALRGLRGVIVQGMQDRVTPPAAARALHAAWPGSQLQMVAGAGHASGHPAMAQALITATEAVAQTTPAHTPQETHRERHHADPHRTA